MSDLDEATYNGLISSVFKRMLATLDGVDPDVLDTEATGDMLTVTAASGEKCIINTQRAVRQIWVAGLGQGLHFDWAPAESRWIDDKGQGVELFAHVERVLTGISGGPFAFEA